jgi:hypothetical protein
MRQCLGFGRIVWGVSALSVRLASADTTTTECGYRSRATGEGVVHPPPWIGSRLVVSQRRRALPGGPLVPRCRRSMPRIAVTIGGIPIYCPRSDLRFPRGTPLGGGGPLEHWGTCSRVRGFSTMQICLGCGQRTHGDSARSVDGPPLISSPSAGDSRRPRTCMNRSSSARRRWHE